MMKRLYQYSWWETPVLLSRTITFFVIVCLLILSVNITNGNAMTCGPGRSESLGWTVPNGDIVLQVGTPLEILCMLNLKNLIEIKKRNYSANDIIFYRNNELIDQRYVSVINETTSKLYMENLNESNDWIYCKLKQNETSINKNDQSSIEASADQENDLFICMNAVAIGTPPKDVDNFKCVSKNWEILNCSWSLPENFVPTNYTVAYMLPPRAGRNKRFGCPTETDYKKNYCVWTRNSDPAYKNNFEYLKFVIEGKNQFNTSVQSVDFHNYAHIIPNSPILELVNKTSSSIYLKWNIGPFNLYDKGLKYKIQYTWKKDANWTGIIYDSKNLTTVKNNVYLNVTNLPYPHMLYNFRVFMKTVASNVNTGWSEPATDIFRTLPCPPYKSPRTDVGSFEIVLNSDSSRTVYVYWEPLDSIEFNGDEFFYNITVLEDNNALNLTAVSMKYSYAEFNISLNSYQFFIRSVNAEGSAPYASVVNIPRNGELVKQCASFTKTDYGTGEYELSWEPPQGLNDEIVNYTIFSCESNKERPHQCDGHLRSIHFPFNVTKYNYTVQNNATNYHFAVSVNTANSSSGMLWASCTVLYGRVGVVNNLHAESIDSYSVNVEWKLECMDKTGVIEGYRVFYCVVSSPDSTRCEEREQYVDEFGGIHRTNTQIRNLKPYTQYKMSVMIFTRDNRTGSRSLEVSTRTKDGRPDVSNVVIKILSVTNTTAEISWNKPKKTNGVLKYYSIRYNNEILNVSANETRVQLSGLESYREYKVTLRACTILDSDPSEVVSFRTKIGIPGDIAEVSGKGVDPETRQAFISWKAPATPSGPNPIYDVAVLKENMLVSTMEINETKATVPLPDCDGEKPQLFYDIKIRAKNVDNDVVHAGNWKHINTVTCSGGISLVWKVMACIFVPLFLAVVFLCGGKTGMYKCNRMKSIRIAMPGRFSIKFPEVERIKERKGSETSESYSLPQIKRNNDERSTLVKKKDFEVVVPEG